MVSKGGKVPEEIVIAEICEKFGWTLEQYLNQPNWFLDIIKEKMRVEGEYQRKQEKDAKRTH